jgi:hypothetical protein
VAVYKATINAKVTSTGALVMPSFHYKTDPPPLGDEPNPNDVADALWSHFGTAALACMDSGISVQELILTEEVLSPDIGTSGVHTVGANGTRSTGAGHAVPRGITQVLDRHTGVRSRSSRGWTMWPGPLGSDDIAGNLFASGWDTAIDALCALLDDHLDIGTVTTTRVTPIVYSKTRRQRAENPYTFDVTTVTANRVPSWLRSRMTAP